MDANIVDHRYKAVRVEACDRTLMVQFNRAKSTNPFSRQMTLELMSICRYLTEAGQNSPYSALLLTGGVDRSFSVGGDFCDVSQLEFEDDIRSYLGEIIDLYQSLLRVPMPVIAAIDHFAIGQGLQVALMADWRIGSHRSSLQMPELKNGVACPLGAIILEQLLGRAKMLEYVMDCGFIDSDAARSDHLLNQLCEPHQLLDYSLAKAAEFAAYPVAPFVTTKKIHNRRFIEAIEAVREDASQAHVAAFLRKSGQSHFNRVLGRDQ